MKLTELPCNISALVTSIAQVPIETRHQLAVLGILPNTPIKIIRMAPLGGTFQVQIRNSSIALNQIIAQQIEVEVMQDE